MVWITFGVPKPFSTHHSARYFIRSMSGLRRNSSGSIGGKFGLVNPMASSLGVHNNVVVRQTSGWTSSTAGPTELHWWFETVAKVSTSERSDDGSRYTTIRGPLCADHNTDHPM